MKVLLVEDNASDADLVKCQLESLNDIELSLVQTLSEAIKTLENNRFDIILLDLNLPDGWGLESLIKLRRQITHIPVVVLTSLTDEQLGVMAIQRGAQDYLIKGSDQDRLVQSLRYALERMRAQAAQEPAAETASRHQDSVTERELQVLQLLREGCTNNEIGERLGIAPTTVKSHITNILQKFAVTGRTKAVVEGLRRGLI
ncbi:MAG: response regulator transcription factor [Candidatus Obscuribacterales bacterium]|nr:response regulator transcription factor [Candidatus Obscuribacterales bacterium]